MAASEWEKLWFAVFGAILTLVVALITALTGRWFRVRSVKRGMLAEMYELRFKLATNIWLLARRLGKVDESLLNEISSILEAYTRPEDKATLIDALDLVRQFQPEMRQSAIDEISKPQTKASFVVVAYTLPFFKAHQSELGLFPVKLQTKLLRVVMNLDMFNHLAELSERLIERTFAVVGENMKITEDHIRSNNADIFNHSKVLLRMISDLPLDRRFSWRWPWRRKS